MNIGKLLLFNYSYIQSKNRKHKISKLTMMITLIITKIKIKFWKKNAQYSSPEIKSIIKKMMLKLKKNDCL